MDAVVELNLVPIVRPSKPPKVKFEIFLCAVECGLGVRHNTHLSSLLNEQTSQTQDPAVVSEGLSYIERLDLFVGSI